MTTKDIDQQIHMAFVHLNMLDTETDFHVRMNGISCFFDYISHQKECLMADPLLIESLVAKIDDFLTDSKLRPIAESLVWSRFRLKLLTRDGESMRTPDDFVVIQINSVDPISHSV